MVAETFLIYSNASPIISIIFIFPAASVFFVGVYMSLRSRLKGTKFVALIVVVALIAAGIGSVGFVLGKNANSPASITISNGYVKIDSSETGTINVSSSQITYAFVSQIHTGNLTIKSKQHGLNNNADNIGVFTLSNGATAYVLSDNSTNLFIKMNSGKYLIVGTSNLTGITSLFSKEVFPVSG